MGSVADIRPPHEAPADFVANLRLALPPDAGYVWRELKHPRKWSVNNRDLGVRIHLEQFLNACRLRVSTRRGTEYSHLIDSLLQYEDQEAQRRMIAYLVSLTGRDIRPLVRLAQVPPLRFLDSGVFVGAAAPELNHCARQLGVTRRVLKSLDFGLRHLRSVQVGLSVLECSVGAMVSINDDLTITDDVSVPDKECWFLVLLSNRKTAKYAVVDAHASRFYWVRTRSVRLAHQNIAREVAYVTNSGPHSVPATIANMNSSGVEAIDHLHLTKLDARVIKQAIRDYVSTMHKSLTP